MVFGSRTKLAGSLNVMAAEIANVRSSTDRAAAKLDELMGEQKTERMQAASRLRKVVLTGLLLAAISAAVSTYLLTASLPASPIAADPGRIGVVLPDGASGSSFAVDASFDASVEDTATFKIVVSAFPAQESTEFSTSVGFLFCGAIRSGLELTEANSREQPVPQAIRNSLIEADSRLGYRSECDYVTVTTSTWQVILSGSSDHALATTAAQKVLYVLPGVTTVGVDEEINGLVVRPLPREARVRVSMQSIPADLTITASEPLIPDAGKLTWTSDLAEALNPPSEYRIAGLLGDRENAAQATLFTAGALAGFAGAAALWALAALVEGRPNPRSD